MSKKAKASEAEESFPVGVDVESEFSLKFGTSRLSDNGSHMKAYLGLRHSMDGWRYLIGFKIAGVKVKFPVYIIEKDNSVTQDANYSVA